MILCHAIGLSLSLTTKNGWSDCRSFLSQLLNGPAALVNLEQPKPKRPLCEAFSLLNDLADGAGAYGASAFTDGEAQTLLHRDWRVQRDLQRDVVAGHAHLRACRQLRRTCHVRGPEVELGTVAVEERCVTSPASPR